MAHKLAPTLHAGKLLCRIDVERLREHGRAVEDFLADLISFVSSGWRNVSLLDDFKQGQLELVFPLLPHAQVGKDKERSVGVVEILQVVKRRDGCARQEASFAIVNDVKLVFLLIPSDKASEEEVVGVCACQPCLPSRA